MSGIELYIDDIDGRTHAAALRHGSLIDLYVDTPGNAVAWGATYLGKILKIDKRLDAAIVDIGDGLTGIMAAKHVQLPGMDPTAPRPDIEKMIAPGQNIIVQVKSEADTSSQHELRKLPRLTMKLCVIGQYLIYSPSRARHAARRALETPKAAQIAETLPASKGWLIKRNAEKAAQADLDAEAEGLLEEWKLFRAAAESADKTPRLIKEGPDAIRRVMNDYGAIFDHIHAGNRRVFERLSGWCAAFNPSLASSKRLRLFKADMPRDKLFDTFDIYGALAMLQEKEILLPRGGSIIFDKPHAFNVIDVNQGSGASASEVNQDAAREIARQVRLRNLSGAILIDFIGMSHKSERFQLVDTLENLFADDGASAQIHGFTRLGIIEMTRKRRTATYAEKMRVTLAKNV